jgi:hypothetical protein
VLKTGGRMVLVYLTEAVDLPSRLVMRVWKAVYRIHPLLLGGCRPVEVLPHLRGFAEVRREVVVQLGVPSAVVVAVR